jgi:hypothetical protein
MSAASIPGALAAAMLTGLLSVPAATVTAQTAADSAASAATGVYPAPPVAPDTGRSGGDTARGDSAAPSGPLVVNVAPPDTILLAACAGAPPGSMAEGILAVVFRSGSTDRERVAAAKTVDGVLAGPATSVGEEYIRLTSAAPSLTVAADRLIRQDAVTRVSPAPCPPPALPPAPPSTPAPAAPAGPATPPAGRDTTSSGGSAAPDSGAATAPGPSATPPP